MRSTLLCSSAIDGVLAEQISATGRLDDLDAQLGEIKDILIHIISLLEPNEDNQ